MGKCLRRKREIGPKTVKLCRCGQMLHVQTNGAVRANDGKGNMLRVRTRIAYADECCMFGKLSHVDGEKAMKERKFESLQNYKRNS